MYNRYLSQELHYGPIPQPAEDPPSPPPGGGGGRLGGLLGRLFPGERGEGNRASQALSTLLKNAGLQELDTGDLLLALIVLFLILEDGDDLELLIALGLMLALHLGEP